MLDLLMPKLTSTLLVIVKVNECGTNWLQKMLLQEDMHQKVDINTVILKVSETVKYVAKRATVN